MSASFSLFWAPTYDELRENHATWRWWLYYLLSGCLSLNFSLHQSNTALPKISLSLPPSLSIFISVKRIKQKEKLRVKSPPSPPIMTFQLLQLFFGLTSSGWMNGAFKDHIISNRNREKERQQQNSTPAHHLVIVSLQLILNWLPKNPYNSSSPDHHHFVWSVCYVSVSW